VKSHVESLEAVGEHAQARDALGAFMRWLEAQVVKIDDPAAQRSFREEVPEHAQLRRMAQVA
jgi:hypothetical protein